MSERSERIIITAPGERSEQLTGAQRSEHQMSERSERIIITAPGERSEQLTGAQRSEHQ